MAIFSALGSFVAGPFGGIAASAVSALLGARAAREQRKQTIADQDNQFVRMRNAATKAGFNPLTVLRNGGAQMFGGVPTFSKAGFMQQFVQQGYNAWTTHPANDPLKKYNDEIRRLEKSQRQADLDLTPLRGKLMKAQIDSLVGEVDPYIGYEGFIPVKVGVNEQYLQIDVAKRLGILPNTPITAGELEEIKGEIQGGFETAFGSKIGTEVLQDAPIFGNNATIETTKLPPLGKDNLDHLLEDLKPIIGATTGRNRARRNRQQSVRESMPVTGVKTGRNRARITN